MNLANGEFVDREQSLAVLDTLEQRICATLADGMLNSDAVVEACDRLIRKIDAAQMLPALLSLGMDENRARGEIGYAKTIMSKEYLHARLQTELGRVDWQKEEHFVPFGQKDAVWQAIRPLGTLLHIAAGNVDALPIYSVIEGLLAGNINILKLPGADDGLSCMLLAELIKEEPRLAEYIYVFDYPSEETKRIEKMAKAADAVVVWGGDDAVRAVRAMAHANTKLIEWGHKISFGYVSGENISDKELLGLATNMWETNQLFCNSCQGIFLDTDDLEELRAFGDRFARILEKASVEKPRQEDVFLRAKLALEVYTETLEMPKQKKWVLRAGDAGSVIVYADSSLAPSYHFGNAWVKPLPRDNIMQTLHPYKNHLQTVALLCGDEKKRNLSETFFRLGVVRVTDGWQMSQNYCGMPHDGEYPLQRYTKRVTWKE